MTHYTSTWTKKHTDLAISEKLTKNAWALWEWLVHQGLEGKTEVVDLKDFNRYIAKKTGKPLDNRTVKASADRLMKANILRWDNLTTFVRRATVKLIRELLPPKLRCRDCNLSAMNVDLQASNPCSVKQGDIAAAADLFLISKIGEEAVKNLEENVAKCEEAGIHFSSEDAATILTWEDTKDVEAAIKLFFKRGGHIKVKNPEGWIRDCLEKRWFEKKVFKMSDALIFLCQLVGVDYEESNAS
jgi:hypothetical protein